MHRLNVCAATSAATLLLLFAVSPAQAASKSASPSAPAVGHLVWSIAPSLAELDQTAHLVTARADGSRQIELTPQTSGVNDIDATLSPDGRRVLFERDTDSSAELRMVPAAGGPSSPVDIGCTAPCLGAGGGTWLSEHRIAFSKLEEAGNPVGYTLNLYTANASGGQVRRLSPADADGVYEDQFARVSADGSYLTFRRARIADGAVAIFRMSPRSTRVQQLTPWDLHADLYDLSRAQAGPTRDLVVFQTFGEGHPEGSARDIATVPATCPSLAQCTAQIRFVTHNGAGVGRDSNPAWSPDGRRIAVAARPSSADVDCQIVTMRYDGSDLRVVSTSRAFDYRPGWGR